MSAIIFLEGGGDSEVLRSRCREGFRKLLERCGLDTRKFRATRNCKNAYAKGKRSFEILGKLDPDVLAKHLPSFSRVRRILKEKL